MGAARAIISARGATTAANRLAWGVLFILRGETERRRAGGALAERMGVSARLLDGFEMREGPQGPVPYFEGAELEVRFFDNAG